MIKIFRQFIVRNIGRRNSNEADLNRNFPSKFKNGRIGKLRKMSKDKILLLPPSSPDLKNNEITQPETKAIMRWVLDNPFVLSLILHGGAAGAFYPYDDGLTRYGGSTSQSGYLSATPDNKVFSFLSKTYASNHEDMHLGKPCWHPGTPPYSFKNGYGNGAEWYPLSGSMNDFNYIFSNCLEVTVELTCCKKPDASTLPSEWRKNVKSLIEYLKQVHIGVKGLVIDKDNKPVAGAEVEVIGNEKKIETSTDGEYWKLLLPGKYQIRAKGLCQSGQCKVSEQKNVIVRKGEVTILNITLSNKSGTIME